MNNTQKVSKKNAKLTGPKNALKNASKGRQRDKPIIKAINCTDSDEEIVVWTEGYFGLTQIIDEKRGPKYKCTECLALFNTRLSFLTHSKYHLKPFCILCGIYTNNEDEMANHKINNHREFIEIVKPIVKNSEGSNIPINRQSAPLKNVQSAPLKNALLTAPNNNNVQMNYSVLHPKQIDAIKSTSISQPKLASPNAQFTAPNQNLLIMNNSQYLDAQLTNQDPVQISEFDNSINNSAISILSDQNEFNEDNQIYKNMETQSSLVTGSEIKTPRTVAKKTFKSKAKAKNEDEVLLATPVPKTKFSRSGRCITMKSFNY